MEEDLEKSRLDLIVSINEFCTYYGYHGVVVFDAHFKMGLKENKEKFHSVEVVYTKKGQTADSYIEKLTFKLLISILNHVEVVTKDLAIQSAIFNMGALRALPEEIEMKIDNMRKRNLKKHNKFISNESESIERIMEYKIKKR
jgi:predicted RNA-binding protein with PIN domain